MTGIAWSIADKNIESGKNGKFNSFEWNVLKQQKFDWIVLIYLLASKYFHICS